jgi:putative ABC transport system substrate-binding protein
MRKPGLFSIHFVVLRLAVVVVAEAQQSKKIGENVTGLSILGPELITKRLEILSEVIPKLTRVGILMRAGVGAGPGQKQEIEEIRAAASALNPSLQELPTLAPDIIALLQRRANTVDIFPPNSIQSVSQFRRLTGS